MFVVPIQTYILIYKKIYEHWGVAGTLLVVQVPTLYNLDRTCPLVDCLFNLVFHCKRGSLYSVC